MRRRTLFGSSGPVLQGTQIEKSAVIAGDVCLVDKTTNNKIFVRIGSSGPIFENHEPIGIVTIPASHNVYGTGECAIISIKAMNYTTPDTGSSGHQYMYWGQYGAGDISTLTNYSSCVVTGTRQTPTSEATGAASYPYMPSDQFSGTVCPTDPEAFYYNSDTNSAAPSPYLSDGSRNPVYYQTSSPATTANTLSDFNGVSNTKILTDLATAQTDWKTASTITNNSDANYSPAACCCWRFHTVGTVQGDWYLPAMGELCYMMARIKKINASITALKGVYGDAVGVELNTSNSYWSSSEYNSYDARRVDTSNGYVANNLKLYNLYVRAFLRV